MKILNLYAGIGGNRELWTNCNVTSVENDSEIAKVLKRRYPYDTVIVEDALEYVAKFYSLFDFIWASPPCVSHGQYRHNVGVLGKGYSPIIPDTTSLYGLIIFLKTYYKGLWCVENTIPYYTPLISPQIKLQRHLFWSNFSILYKKFSSKCIRYKNKISDFECEVLVGSNIKNKRQVLRNMVDGEVGKHIYKCMLENKRVIDSNTAIGCADEEA